MSRKEEKEAQSGRKKRESIKNPILGENMATPATAFPRIEFKTEGAKLSRWKLNEGNPRIMEIGDDMKIFTLQFMKTVDMARQRAPSKLLLLLEEGHPHMTFACSILALSYAKKLSDEVTIKFLCIAPKDAPSILGHGGCLCSKISAGNPDLLREAGPMATVGRFSATCIASFMEEWEVADLQPFKVVLVDATTKMEMHIDWTAAPAAPAPAIPATATPATPKPAKKKKLQATCSRQKSHLPQ